MHVKDRKQQSNRPPLQIEKRKAIRSKLSETSVIWDDMKRLNDSRQSKYTEELWQVLQKCSKQPTIPANTITFFTSVPIGKLMLF